MLTPLLTLDSTPVQTEGQTKQSNTRTDHLIPGPIFFASERVDLTASWSCLFRSSVLVLVYIYSSVPVTVTSLNSPNLSRRVCMNLFNVIESATFHCFLQLRKQEEVTRSKISGVGRV